MDTQRRPLIILGAGASHDFVNEGLRRSPMPPLTNSLVLQEYLNYNTVRTYKEVGDLLSRVAPLVLRKRNPLSFEEALGEIATPEEAVALRFYLSDLFRDISYRNLVDHSLNNYRALIGYVEHGAAKGADVITFNYDTLFEGQFGDRRIFRDINDYIAETHPVRIFKVHGSADWFYIVRKTPMQKDWGIANGYDYLKRNKQFAPGPIHTRTMLDGISEAADFHRIPALALPAVDTKQFLLPDDQLQVLKGAIAGASRILIIGWKAGDRHLLDLMNEHIKHRVPVFVVTGPRGGDEIKQNLSSVRNLEIAGEEKGFSAFIGSTMAKTFFGLN